MSGALMAQVGDACKPGGKCENLNPHERLALLAIADRCHTHTRQGGVPISHIMDWAGVSRATAFRIRDRLAADGYVIILRRGRRQAHHGTTAPTYELAGFLATLPLRP